MAAQEIKPVWEDKRPLEESEEVKAWRRELSLAMKDPEFWRPLTTLGFETTPELEAALDFLAEHGPVRRRPLGVDSLVMPLGGDEPLSRENVLWEPDLVHHVFARDSTYERSQERSRTGISTLSAQSYADVFGPLAPSSSKPGQVGPQS